MSDYSSMIKELSDMCKRLEDMSSELSPPSFDDKGFGVPYVSSEESSILSNVKFTLQNVISLLHRKQ